MIFHTESLTDLKKGEKNGKKKQSALILSKLNRMCQSMDYLSFVYSTEPID